MMSADNGIYILETEGPEYRVSELMAVENYLWDDINAEQSADPDVWIRNAREMWIGHVYRTKAEALESAAAIEEVIAADDFPILEYGISIISIPRRF